MPTRRQRFLIAVLAGLLAGTICYLLSTAHGNAGDFTWLWRAARALIAGQNPYRDPRLGPGNPYPGNAPLYYPLPAVLLVLPVAWLPATAAGAVFVAGSVGLLAWAAAGEGWGRLLMLLSPSLAWAIYSAQWSPLAVVVLALLPGMSALGLALKPNLGLGLAASRPALLGMMVAAALGLISLVVLPSWPLDWLRNLGQNRHTLPLLAWPPALLLLAAAVRWREREGRLLLVLALVPQRLIWYDQLPLFLVPRTLRQSALLLGAGWLGFVGWRVSGGVQSLRFVDDTVGPWAIASTYLPALAILLWQALPTLVRAAARAPVPAADHVDLGLE